MKHVVGEGESPKLDFRTHLRGGLRHIVDFGHVEIAMIIDEIIRHATKQARIILVKHLLVDHAPIYSISVAVACLHGQLLAVLEKIIPTVIQILVPRNINIVYIEVAAIYREHSNILAMSHLRARMEVEVKHRPSAAIEVGSSE